MTTRRTTTRLLGRAYSFPLVHIDSHYGDSFDLVIEDQTASFTLPLGEESGRVLAHAIAYQIGDDTKNPGEIKRVLMHAHAALTAVLAADDGPDPTLSPDVLDMARAAVHRIEDLADNVAGMPIEAVRR